MYVTTYEQLLQGNQYQKKTLALKIIFHLFLVAK